ncbi:MAG: hypothetical protein IM613_12045 [Cytophagales bacterium]|jgi:hypothetical protein|nr:hypothetical protein [Cytophagales bacterium]
MPIDIDDLLIYDVEIKLLGEKSILVDSQHTALIADVRALPSPIWVCGLGDNSAMIQPSGDIDIISLAERIALSWESEGYKVKRVARDSTIVQSFISV